jgi:hypothetical protein
MSVLRLYLGIMFLGLGVYTIVVGTTTGWNLAPSFIGDLFAVNWSGQFNFDFAIYLSLSAGWIAWRHNFTPAAIALALFAAVGGILVFAPYVIFQSLKADGNAAVLLLGPTRANR